MALLTGDPFPSFRAPGNSNPNSAFDSAAGRYLVLAVLSGASDAEIEAATALAARHRAKFDDDSRSFFGLLPDRPEWRGRLPDAMPGVRWLYDFGAVRDLAQVPDGPPQWIVIDPSMRVLACAGPDRAEELLAGLDHLPPPDRHAGVASHAPVLILPRIFEPGFCQVLIDHYDRVGGQESGFMREVDGVTKLMTDPNHKKRSDVLIEDQSLVTAARARIARRLVPEIKKAFQYEATRIERYLVATYDAATGGYFRPHRDNTTKGTAHRRFAVSINLNHDFDGGDLRFPEYGATTLRPPPGGAVVFSCSLLHEATPVTRGRRYAFLPFLYDEAAARVREENLKFLDPTGLRLGTPGQGAPVPAE